MTFQRMIGKFVVASAICAVALVCSSIASASLIPVRTGSSYGEATNFGTCQQRIVDFLNGIDDSSCEGFINGQFTINGTDYTGAEFIFFNGPTFGILDVIDLGANSTLTLNLANIALPTGVFLCDGSGGNTLLDNHLDPIPNSPACTSSSLNGGTASSPDFSGSGLSATYSLTGVAFTTLDNPFVLFTEDGNLLGATFTTGATVPTETPEPTSLVLLGTGLIALVGLRRRKQ